MQKVKDENIFFLMHTFMSLYRRGTLELASSHKWICRLQTHTLHIHYFRYYFLQILVNLYICSMGYLKK